jgi:hypothetical protein
MARGCATTSRPLRLSMSSLLSLCSIRPLSGLRSGCCWFETGYGRLFATSQSSISATSCPVLV